MTEQATANIIMKFAGSEYSAHGLRTGFMTSAANNGASLEKTLEVIRYIDYRVVMGFITEVNKFSNCFGSGLI